MVSSAEANLQRLSHRALWVNPRFEIIEHPRHDDQFANLGCFVPGRRRHNIMESLFFELQANGSVPVPLFNGTTAYLYFAVFSKATSLAVTTVLGNFGLSAECGLLNR